MKTKKRILEFGKDDNMKFKAVADYLVAAMVSFNAYYRVTGESTIEFACDDSFYNYMMEEVPRIYYGED